MSFSPVLIFHIYSGSMALLSGAAAMFFRKGSRRHRLAGDAFVLSMIGLGTSGAFMGFMRHEPMNVAMGVLTGYLVVTAWMTASSRWVSQAAAVAWARHDAATVPASPT